MEKCKLIIYFFRISSTCRRSLLGRILGFPVRLSYLLIVRWLLGVDIPDSVVIGDGLKIYHGYGLVVHGNAVLGENITLRHSTTIGNNGKTQACPQIGNNVDIGCHVVIIGDVKISDNVTIGAGSVITKSIEEPGVYLGNPLKRIK